jgi:uncharacterized circularly permuted ATP-grasp superfamily protein
MATIAALKHPQLVSALDGYDPGDFYCELLGGEKQPARQIAPLWHCLETSELSALRQRASDAESELFKLGITFTVYTEKDAIDRILPFDVIPRVLTASAWAKIEAGVKQRVTALNMFLHDVYHERKILKDGVVPAELVLGNVCYRPEMVGLDLPCGTYIHINGTDIVRDRSGAFLVLEDNGRSPSGVVRGREPAPHATRIPGPDERVERSAGVRLRQAIARQAARGGAGRHRQSECRAAVARHL